MKLRIAGLGALFLSLLTFSAFYYDDDLVKKIAQSLDAWLNDHPQEKVHLHLDRPYYATGDTIWFKAYVTIGEEHRLSALSNIVNVELINSKDSLSQRIRVPLVAGLGWGEFVLPDTLTQGNYRIRAYTNWMRNQDEAYFFDKRLTIQNAITNKVYTNTTYSYATVGGVPQITAVVNYTDITGSAYAGKQATYDVQLSGRRVTSGKGVTDAAGNLVFTFTNKNVIKQGRGTLLTSIKLDNKEWVSKTMPIASFKNDIDVQFFPESGYLVNGVASKLAFKAVGADGLGRHIKGVIKDDTGTEVAKLESQHLGMGVCAVTPVEGRTYKATITTDEGMEKVVDLPAARPNGYVLNIDNSNPEFVTLRLLGTASTAIEPLTVVGQANGKLLYAAITKEGSNGFRANIRKNRFPSGIVQFTLFSASGKPLNERLVFIQHPDDLKINVSADKDTYAPRVKVQLNISSKNVADSLVEGSFSVAVIDEGKIKVDEEDENTIFTDLLLTSDIKGYVEKPNYYFINPSDKTRADLDILMLTQGYRRFDWQQLLNGAISKPTFEAEKGLSISGTILEKGKPLAGAKVTLINAKGGLFTIDTVADAKGKFHFNDLLFVDSAGVVIQATNAKGKKNNIEVVIDKIAPVLIAENPNLPEGLINIGNATRQYLQRSRELFNMQMRYGVNDRGIMLNEVVIREKKKKESHSSNLNGAGSADQVITAKDISQGCSSLAICLAGRLFGVSFKNGVAYSTRSMGSPMMIMIDGVQVGEDQLSFVSPGDVESVEVLRTIGSLAIYGSRGANGIILITTKRGAGTFDYSKETVPGIAAYSTIGYHVSRKFYSLAYDVPSAKKDLPDLRTTIYWDPLVFTEKGNTSVSYFNADGKGTYRVVIEGIDNMGHIGRQVYRYKVE